MSIRDEGYEKFSAAESDVNDQAQDCAATLTVVEKSNQASYVGKTGKSQGHAEMHALDQFLMDLYQVYIYDELDALVKKKKLDIATSKNEEYIANYAIERFDKVKKQITCEDKSCCINCSAILGHLGITASSNTYKTKQRMGKATQYGLGIKVRNFVTAYLKKLGY